MSTLENTWICLGVLLKYQSTVYECALCLTQFGGRNPGLRARDGRTAAQAARAVAEPADRNGQHRSAVLVLDNELHAGRRGGRSVRRGRLHPAPAPRLPRRQTLALRLQLRETDPQAHP